MVFAELAQTVRVQLYATNANGIKVELVKIYDVNNITGVVVLFTLTYHIDQFVPRPQDVRVERAVAASTPPKHHNKVK